MIRFVSRKLILFGKLNAICPTGFVTLSFIRDWALKLMAIVSRFSIKQAFACYYLRILLLVDDVIHRTLEVASFYDFSPSYPYLGYKFMNPCHCHLAVPPFIVEASRRLPYAQAG